MGKDAPILGKETLHQELLPRVVQLRRYVHRRIPDRLYSTVSADDILQEVWMAAYRTVSTFTPDGPNAVERWLTTIAKSKLADAIRTARRLKRGGDARCVRNARKRFSSITELFARIKAPQRTPSSEFGAAENGHAVFIALHRLSEDHRRAVYLRHIEGRSHEEIAREMKKSEAAVHSLVYNGLCKLRTLLGDADKYFGDAQSAVAGQASRKRSC